MNNLKVKLDTKMKFMIFSLIAFILTLITAAYAWVTSDLLSNSTALYVGSVSLSVLYRGTSDVIIADLAPGESVTKEFQVENNGSSDQIYNLHWINVTNNLVDKNYFMYTIRNVDTDEVLFYPKYLPTNSTHIKYGISIPAGETHNYIMTIYYVDDPKYNQLQNADLYFAGDLSIEQGSNEQKLEDRLSIFVDGQHSDYLPTLSEYSIDTTRTFCTEGSSISIVNGDLEISNLSDVTSCELYLVSSTAASITNDPYNLLIIDPDGGTMSSTPEIKYRYSGDIVSLGVPEKSGYAFMGWQASGSGTQIVDNIKVLMGNTYSYVKAIWAEGHWNRIVQTCGENGVSTYTRTYKTCDSSISNYTQTDKTCGVSSWTKTTSVCGIATVTKKTFNCAASGWSYPSTANTTETAQTATNGVVPSNTTQSCSSASHVGNKKITNTTTEWRKKGKRCTASSYTYDTSTSYTSTNCMNSIVTAPNTCSSSNLGSSYITDCKHHCRQPSSGNNGTCVCYSTDMAPGALYDAGCVQNESRCMTVCSGLGGSFRSYTPNDTCACPNGGTLEGSYCYKKNQTSCSTANNWANIYAKTTKTCTATVTMSDFNNLTNDNCENSVVTAPSSCTVNNVGDHITSCEKTKYTRRTYICAASSWSYPSTAATTTTVAPSNCSATTPSCSAAGNVGNIKVTCGDPKTYNWTSSTTSTSATCQTSGSCSSSTNGNSYVTACTAKAYNFGDETPSTVASCTPNTISCSSSTNGQVNRTCTPNYNYSLSSTTQTDEVESCATSNFTCDSTTFGSEYTTLCQPKTYGYGYSSSTTTSSYCFVDETHDACNANTDGSTYTYACEFVAD